MYKESGRMRGIAGQAGSCTVPRYSAVRARLPGTLGRSGSAGVVKREGG